LPWIRQNSDYSKDERDEPRDDATEETHPFKLRASGGA
jgi:hypothetical protein